MLNEKIDPGIVITFAIPEGFIAVRSGEIAYIVKDGNRARATLLNGETMKSVQSFEAVKKLLLKTPDFAQIQRTAAANLAAVVCVTPIPGQDYLLTFNEKIAPIELNAAYAAGVLDYYGIRTLEHVEPFDRPSYWLMKENIKYYEKPIYLMTREELLTNFADQSGQAVISLLIANFLYQFAIRIREGLADPLEGGNVRSLWYMIKPAISKLGALEGSDHYKTLSEVLARLVTHKIVTYREYGLIEEENWVIGGANPHVILLAEKRAHLKFIKTFNEQYGITAISTGGVPGMITMEYFCEALKKAVPQADQKQIPIITLTDYDPSGDLIVSTFIDNLRSYGIYKTLFIRLVCPAHFTPEEIEAYKYSLVGDNEATPTMVKKWLKKTGGIDGQAYGLETDALMITPAKVRQLFLEKAKPYLKRK